MNAVSMRTSSRAEVRSGPIYFSSTRTLTFPHESQRQVPRVPSPLPLTHGSLVAGELHFTQKYCRDFFIKLIWPTGFTGSLAFHPSRPTYYQRVCGCRPRSSTFTTIFQIFPNPVAGAPIFVKFVELWDSVLKIVIQKTVFKEPQENYRG